MKKDNIWISIIVLAYIAYLAAYTVKALVEIGNMNVDYGVANSIFQYTKFSVSIAALLFAVILWISVCRGQRQMRGIIRNWLCINLLLIILLLLFTLVFYKVLSIEIFYPMGGINGLMLFLIVCVRFRDRQIKY